MANDYTKPDGNSPLRENIPTKLPELRIAKDSFSKRDIPLGYQKLEGKLDPSLFVIVSGGEKREKDYFSFFENTSTFPRIKIEYISKNVDGREGLDVDELVPISIRIKKEKEESKGNDIIDSINIVTDVDHFYSQILRNIPICEAEKINLVISNPCFEIWLYYTYFRTKPDYEIPENKLKISSGFKTYLNKKIKGGVKPKQAPFDLENAIANSKSNYSIDENKIPGIFSTQMHILGEKLYALTKEEIQRKKIAEEKRVKTFLSKNFIEAIAKRLNRLKYKELLFIRDYIKEKKYEELK